MSEALPDLASPDTPADVAADMASLRAELTAKIPRKSNTLRNLLIATWNIREFSSLTGKWMAAATDRPKRDWRGLWAITEIISRFDVIAVQEAGGDLKSLRTLMKTLGPAWSFIMTDITAGDAGGGERLAYVFNTERVQLSGLACELVVPPEWLAETGPDVLKQQFARTPYAVGFKSGSATFVLTTLHVIFGETSQDRIGEVAGVARWMQDWARRTTAWEQNFIVLGDFNIDRRDDPLYQAFVSRGLTVAPQHRNLARTIFDDDGHPSQSSFYDQIAWFSQNNTPLLNMTLRSGGNFDFRPHVYRGAGLTTQQLSFRLSDHYPLWLEFEIEA